MQLLRQEETQEIVNINPIYGVQDMNTELVRFKDYQPSAFDSNSNYISWDRETEDNVAEWFVVPLIKTRDSRLLEQSNFETATKLLHGESDNVMILNFGHWSCGHYDLILVKPDTPEQQILEDMIEQLDNYPVLDDQHYSELEFNATHENIKSEIPSDLITDLDIDTITDKVYSWLSDNNDSSLENVDDNGGYPDTDAVTEALEALGLYSESDIEQDDRDKLLDDMYPNDCPCETCRTKRVEKQTHLIE